MNLVRYEHACKALAAATSIDEVKDIRDKSEALRAYAHQAQNRDMELDATEIRIRAERRLGEMIQEQKEMVGLNGGGRAKKTGAEEEPVLQQPTLSDAGISKKLSARAQKLSDISNSEFEEKLADWRERGKTEKARISVNMLGGEDKAQRRAERELQLAEKQWALPDKKYGVIVADPEWRFEPWSRKTGMDRAADNPLSDIMHRGHCGA